MSEVIPLLPTILHGIVFNKHHGELYFKCSTCFIYTLYIPISKYPLNMGEHVTCWNSPLSFRLPLLLLSVSLACDSSVTANVDT
jgi:hypothetical protein